ncbi:hypothetical protein H9P43_001460 [Blastocladiella emersonii ATCC 22665]|nr:hypothetical protein H9P43_001460 [Blastocladiella emersonii ATCC 22665]
MAVGDTKTATATTRSASPVSVASIKSVAAAPAQHQQQQPLPNCLLVGTTTHARVHPRRRAFTYPVVYVAVDVDDLAAGRALPAHPRLFGYNQHALYALWDRDYLTAGEAPIRAKAVGVLRDQIGAAAAASVGRIVMVTTPRCVGYAFNPLTVYYCYLASDPAALRAVILEVNNTFGERHVYVCDPAHNAVGVPSAAAGAGYTHAFQVARAFHVSPFNTRKGVYDVLTLSPDAAGRLAVKLTMHVPDERDPAAPLRTVLTADLRARTVRPLTSANVLQTFAEYPVTVFLTIPRVLRQAWGLAFDQKLWVYARPPILAPGSPALFQGRARTIRALPASPLAKWVEARLVAGAWRAAAQELGIRLVVVPADPLADPVVLSESGAAGEVVVRVREAEAWEQLALYADPVQGLLHAYVAGDLEVHGVSTTTGPSADPLVLLLRIALAAAAARTSNAGRLVGLVRRVLPGSAARAAVLPTKQQQWHVAVGAEAQVAGLTWRDQVHLLRLIVVALVVGAVARAYFARMAKFAWSPLGFPDRLAAYAAGRDVAVPADNDPDRLGDDQAEAHGTEARKAEQARWNAFAAAWREVTA